MKKNGFTLAEILIAMAIIGVIAAIAIPGLVTENKKKVWANSLSVAVSNFENAVMSYLIYENENGLSETVAWKDFSEDLGNEEALGYKMKLSKKADKAADYYGTNNTPKPLNPNSQLNALSSAGIAGVAYEANNEMAYFIETIKNNEKVAAKIGIDINGKKKPNIIGRDIFVFHLDQEGYMQPYGNGYNGESKLDDSNCSTKATNVVGEHCATKLITNGYDMDY